MWNIKKLKKYRVMNSLLSLEDDEVKEIVDVLNDMKKGLDEIKGLTNEPFLDFFLFTQRNNNDKN